MLVIREHRLSALSILVLGVGVGVTGFFPSYYGLIFTTLIMSFGFHYYETTNQSLTLQYFDQNTSPLVFGFQRSYGAVTNIVVGVSIMLLADTFSYRQMYLIVGLILCGLGLWGFAQNPVHGSLKVQVKEMVFRRKYWLFYLLTFLAGARRQIFVAFVVFLMVERLSFFHQGDHLCCLYLIMR